MCGAVKKGVVKEGIHQAEDGGEDIANDASQQDGQHTDETLTLQVNG